MRHKKKKEPLSKKQYETVKILNSLDTKTLIQYKEDKMLELENCTLSTEEYNEIDGYIRLTNYILKRRPTKTKKLGHKI